MKITLFTHYILKDVRKVVYVNSNKIEKRTVSMSYLLFINILTYTMALFDVIDSIKKHHPYFPSHYAVVVPSPKGFQGKKVCYW